MSDKFLVLANSRKKIAKNSSGDTGRCIAGIKIQNNGDCEWIRPVDSNTETGAIPIREANKYPLFSLVDIDIIGEDNHKESYQYENKIVRLGTEKTKITKEKFLQILKNFKQDSGNTILGVYPRDRISVEKKGYITGSLKIIAPKYLEFYKQDSTSGKPQIRVKFSFDNKSWRDIVVTDGYFISEYGNNLNYVNSLKEQIYIVTSLGLPFNGYVYLLAACVFFIKDEYFIKENKKASHSNFNGNSNSSNQSIPQVKSRYSREELMKLKEDQEKQRKREDFRDNVGSFFGLIWIILTILFFIYGIIDGISDLFD